MLTKTAPAKINLGLHVLRKREDGFHDIETAFLRIPWSDVLHAQAADDVAMTCTDPALPTDEANLVIRAVCLLRREYGVQAGIHIHLDKRIPYGAGLGGGSSDAAAAMRMANEIWNLRLADEQLAYHGLEIGSDVPFFFGPPAAVGKGRGEKLEPLFDPQTDEPYRPPYPLVVAVPEESVSTAEAYGMITPRAENRPDLAETVLSNDLERWQREITNDFEDPILRRYPAIAEVKRALEAAGAPFAALTGTGAAVFGVFREADAARTAAEALHQAGHRTWRGVV